MERVVMEREGGDGERGWCSDRETVVMEREGGDGERGGGDREREGGGA